MSGLIIRWLINALALWFTSTIVKGITIDGLWGALIAGAVLGIVNAVIRPLFLLLTLPVNLLTLGLFTWVVNALMLLLVAALSVGFQVRGFWAALVGSIILSVVSWLLSFFVKGNTR